MGERNDDKTMVAKIPLNDEPSETAQALTMLERHKQLMDLYSNQEKETLEAEYKRIYSDFNLSMNLDQNLRAIWAVLVEKYCLTGADLGRLRKG